MSRRDNHNNNNTKDYGCRNIGGGYQTSSHNSNGTKKIIDIVTTDNNASESTPNAQYTKSESTATEPNFSTVFLKNDFENSPLQNQENTITEAQKTTEEIIAKAKKSAEDEKERIKAEAKSEADRIKAEAQSEADRIKAEARAETEAKNKELSSKELGLNLRASELERQENELAAEKEKHTSEFNNMIAQAKALGNNLVKQGQSRKDELIAEGEEEKQHRIDSITDEAKRDIQRSAIKELFEADNRTGDEIRKELNDIYCKISGEDNKLRASLSTQASALSDNINECFSASIRALSNHLDSLRGLQNEMVSTLDTWQRGLYTTRLTPLCTCFESISRLIETHEGKLADYQSDFNAPDNQTRIEVLTPIVKTLKIFREQLGRSLAPFGIAVFYPEKGRGFDPDFHYAMDENVIPDLLIDQPITKCIKPGFIKAGYENEPQAVLVKAVVEVETKSPKF